MLVQFLGSESGAGALNAQVSFLTVKLSVQLKMLGTKPVHFNFCGAVKIILSGISNELPKFSMCLTPK